MTRCPIESAEPLGVRIVWTSLVPNFYNMFTFQFSRWKVARNTNLAPQQDQRNTAMFVSRTFPFPPSVTADIFSAPVQSYHRGDSEFNVTTGFRPGPHTGNERNSLFGSFKGSYVPVEATTRCSHECLPQGKQQKQICYHAQGEICDSMNLLFYRLSANIHYQYVTELLGGCVLPSFSGRNFLFSPRE